MLFQKTNDSITRISFIPTFILEFFYSKKGELQPVKLKEQHQPQAAKIISDSFMNLRQCYPQHTHSGFLLI